MPPKIQNWCRPEEVCPHSFVRENNPGIPNVTPNLRPLGSGEGSAFRAGPKPKKVKPRANVKPASRRGLARPAAFRVNWPTLDVLKF
jgi:hypothetical protein